MQCVELKSFDVSTLMSSKPDVTLKFDSVNYVLLETVT